MQPSESADLWSYKKLPVGCISVSILALKMGRVSILGQDLYYLGWRRWSCRRTCPSWSAASPSGSCSLPATRPPARQVGNSLFFFLRFSLLGSRWSRCAPCRRCAASTRDSTRLSQRQNRQAPLWFIRDKLVVIICFEFSSQLRLFF